VSAIRQKFALLISKRILAIRKLVGFSDYRYRLVDCSRALRRAGVNSLPKKTVSDGELLIRP
jgi:hypothetical protein